MLLGACVLIAIGVALVEQDSSDRSVHEEGRDLSISTLPNDEAPTDNSVAKSKPKRQESRLSQPVGTVTSAETKTLHPERFDQKAKLESLNLDWDRQTETIWVQQLGLSHEAYRAYNDLKSERTKEVEKYLNYRVQDAAADATGSIAHYDQVIEQRKKTLLNYENKLIKLMGESKYREYSRMRNDFLFQTLGIVVKNGASGQSPLY